MNDHHKAEYNKAPLAARVKRWLKTTLKLAVSVGLIVFLAMQLDWSAALNRLADARPGFLVAALALLLTQGLISSIKWHVILKADNCNVPLLYLWKTYLIGMFLSLLMPTSYGGDIYRVYAIRGGATGLIRGTSSVLFDRVTGLIAMATLAVIGSLYMADARYVWPIIASYVLVVTIGLLLTSDRALQWMRQWEHKRLGFVVKVLKSFNTYRNDRRRILIIALISLLFQTNIVVISRLYAGALMIDVSFWQLLMVVPLVYMTEALPISINGLGVRESAFVFFFQAIGQTAEAGLAVALLVVIFRYSTGLIGGGLLIRDWLHNWPGRATGGDESASQEARQKSAITEPIERP